MQMTQQARQSKAKCLDAALETDAQLSEGGQPSMGALDHPAMTPEPIIALDTLAGDAALDAATPEVCTAA